MSESLKAAVRQAVLRLLDPLVKWLLEAGMGVGDFVSLAKLAYVRAAREQGLKSGGEVKRPNAARISVVTGLTRFEVANILASDAAEPTHDRGRQRAERVLSGWWSDPSFQDSTTGKPAILPVRGGKRTFAALVDRYSGERWRVATILDELIRVKAVRRLGDGRVEALSRTYATVRWDTDGVIAFGEHLAELTSTLLHNLKSPERARYVRRVVNMRLDPRYVPVLRRELELHAEALADTQYDVLNDSLHTLTGKSGEPEPASLGLTIYVIEPHTVENASAERPIKIPRKPQVSKAASKRGSRRLSHR